MPLIGALKGSSFWIAAYLGLKVGPANYSHYQGTTFE